MFLKPSVDAVEFFVGQAAVQHGWATQRAAHNRQHRALQYVTARLIRGAMVMARVCPSELASARLK
jgi:hypothetical protein